MSEMVERVARAIHVELVGDDPDEKIHHPAQNSWEQPSWAKWEQWVEAARAAIEALREPTEAMCEALEFGDVPPAEDLDGTAKAIWLPSYHAMIDAALTP